MGRISFFLVVAALVGLYAVPASALTGFVNEVDFRAFDPFAVDVYVNFLTDTVQTFVGYVSYYSYNPAVFEQGGFPITDAHASLFTTFYGSFAGVGAVSSPMGTDLIYGNYNQLVGITATGTFESMAFFLQDTILHNRDYGGSEVINRATYSPGTFYSFSTTTGASNVFIGYINDVTGFKSLWAGWYTTRTYTVQETRSVEDFGNYNGLNHILTPAAYLGAGGDPHMVSRSTSSEMSNLLSGDIVNLIDSPHVSVNAAIREFSFLPASMRENNYFGTVAAQLASGDRVLVEASETAEGVPAFSVSLNGVGLEEGALVEAEAFRVQYDRYALLDGAHGHSWFEEQFPFQQHGAIVRMWVYGEIVVDVSLTSKDHFVDWHNATPQVHEQTGAFLNINTRDLKQASETAGLLRAVDGVHKRKLMRERALEAGAQLEERDIDVDFPQVVNNVVDAHRVESLF